MAAKRQHAEFLIVGGGVVGLSLAWELAQRKRSVHLLSTSQQQRPTASWAGAGILPPAPTKNIDDAYDQLRSLSHALHHVWAEQLHRLTGIDTGFRRCGGIYLASTRAELATLVANQFWWEEHGIEYEPIKIEQLHRLEPYLASSAGELLGAWRLPGECQLRNPQHLRALWQACELAGVQMIEAQIDTLQYRSENLPGAAYRAVLHDTLGQTYEADRICLCTGAWTRLLMEQVQLSNGIMPIRGQMLLYQCSSKPLTHVINDGHRYLVPRDDGLVLAGSVEEEAGYECVTTVESIEQIRTWAEARLPLLKNSALIKTWAGLRPGSFDGLPYMGHVHGTENLFVAAGHFRSGLHMSCATAVLMADLMTGQPTQMDLNPFRVSRG